MGTELGQCSTWVLLVLAFFLPPLAVVRYFILIAYFLKYSIGIKCNINSGIPVDCKILNYWSVTNYIFYLLQALDVGCGWEFWYE